MDEIVWAVNPKNDTLKEMADYLGFYAERLFCAPPGLAHELEVPLDLPKIPVTAEVRHNLFMAVKEAINNAVKHGAAQQIRVWPGLMRFPSLGHRSSPLDNGRGFRP